MQLIPHNETGETTMRYLTCCVHSTAEQINAMVDAARPITLRTFRKHVKDLDEWASRMTYDVGNERGGLRLANDWHVAYFKSTYDGVPCVYLDHSRIEHIWT